MSVLLGHVGEVQLRRSARDEDYHSVIVPSDVNAQRNRFSFEFETGMLLTGDLVEIKALDGKPLSFVDPSGWFIPGIYEDGKWFVHVDGVGGINLYLRFDEAVSGEVQGRVKLQVPERDIPISVMIHDNIDRIVGQVTDFQLNTNRDAVDVTELGDDFRQQYSSLISGSGQVTCFFDYQRRMCDEMSEVSGGAIEMPIYLHALLLRTKLGSEFWARLTLAGRGKKPGGYRVDFDDEVWYEFSALVTNVAIAFEATQPVRSVIDFVTTGEIKLRTKMVSNYLIQEQDYSSRIRVEELMGNGFIELEQQE